MREGQLCADTCRYVLIFLDLFSILSARRTSHFWEQALSPATAEGKRLWVQVRPPIDRLSKLFAECSFAEAKLLHSAYALTHDFVRNIVASTSSASIWATMCGHGMYPKIRWMFDEFALLPSDVKHKRTLLWAACEQGQLTFLQYLFRRSILTISDMHSPNNSLFGQVCASGSLALVQWITEQFNPVLVGYQPECDPLREACARGHLAVVQYLTIVFKPPSYMVTNFRILDAACNNGHMLVVKWLVGHFKLKWTNVHKHATFLAATCGGGHLQLLQWLVRHFGLTKRQIRASKFEMFQRACRRQRLEVAQWLVSTFDVTKDDAPEVLQDAAANGHLAVVQWLVRTFTFTLAEIARFLPEVCGSGQLVVVQWLLATFPIQSIKRHRPTILSMLGLACATGTNAMPEWVVHHFRLTSADAIAADAAAADYIASHSLATYSSPASPRWLYHENARQRPANTVCWFRANVEQTPVAAAGAEVAWMLSQLHPRSERCPASHK
jgi:hypothetical protein